MDKNNVEGNLLDGSVFNEEKAQLNGHFGKKNNHSGRENQKDIVRTIVRRGQISAQTLKYSFLHT